MISLISYPFIFSGLDILAFEPLEVRQIGRIADLDAGACDGARRAKAHGCAESILAPHGSLSFTNLIGESSSIICSSVKKARLLRQKQLLLLARLNVFVSY